MMKISALQRSYLSQLLKVHLSAQQWRLLESQALSPKQLLRQLKAYQQADQHRACPLPSTFENFFEQHFGYALEPQQLELFEWFVAGLQAGLVQERQLLATRRIGKTDILTIGAVCWKLLHDRNFKVIIISKSQATINVINKKMRQILQHYQAIAQATSKAILLKGARQQGDKAFSVVFLTQGSSKRGLRAHHIVMDDLLDASDASAAVRMASAAAYHECRSIIPSTTFISQLAHEQDLASSLRKRDDVQTKELWLGDVADQLRAKIGLQELQQLESQYPKRYIGHNFTGHHYKDSAIQHFAQVASGEFAANAPLWAFVDPSFGGKDKTGISIIGIAQQRIYAKVMESAYDLSKVGDVAQLLQLLKAKGVSTVVVEVNNGGDILFNIPEVYQLVQQLEISLDRVRNTKPKVQRIMGLYPYRHRLVLSGDVACVQTWESDVSSGARGYVQPDDGIDSLAMGVAYLSGKGVLMMMKEES